MKPITIHVSEPVYRELREYAKREDRSTAEVIREAMALYRDQRIRKRSSLRELAPLDLGEVLRPIGPDEDLLDEMLGG